MFALVVLISGFIAKLILIYYFYDADDFELAAEAAAAASSRHQTTIASDDVPWDEALVDGIFALFSPDRLSLFAIDLTHMVSGFILVGLMGCFSLIYYISLNPFSFGTTRIGLGKRGGDSLGAVVLVILVLIGVVKMLYEIYKAVKDWSRKSMEMVEARILDVDEGE